MALVIVGWLAFVGTMAVVFHNPMLVWLVVAPLFIPMFLF